VYTRDSEMIIANSHLDGTETGDDIINLVREQRLSKTTP